MKKANILRAAAVIAVVVLASMTTGCLKASIKGKIEPAPLTLATDVTTFKGTLTLTMTGLLGGGTYETLQVRFFKGDEPVANTDINSVKINLTISPFNKVASVALDEIEGLIVPEALWNQGELLADKAEFTVTAGIGFGLDPVVIQVGLKRAAPAV